MGQIYEQEFPGKVQADGNWEVTQDDVDDLENATRHQVSVEGGEGGATSGTVAVMVKPYGRRDFEALTLNGVQITIDIASPKTYTFKGNIKAFRFDPTDVTGGDGTYGAAVSGWN